MIDNQAVKYVGGFICLVFGLLAAYGIYSGLYKRANDTDYAYVGKYALYVDQEGNVEDVSKKGDLSKIDMTKVETMEGFFQNCIYLETFPTIDWNIII